MPMVAGSSPVFFVMLKNLKSFLTSFSIRSNSRVIFFVVLIGVAFLFVSSFLGILWLFLPTVYFLFKKQYKNIFSIWGGLFIIWYLMFTACMFGFDGPIIIHPDFFDRFPKECFEPGEVLHPLEYVIVTLPYKGSVTGWLRNICMETLLLLALISNKLCCSMHVPSLLKGMVHLFTRILRGNPSAYCSPEEESRKPFSPKSVPYSPHTSNSSWWRDSEVVPPRPEETIKPPSENGWWGDRKVVPPQPKEPINPCKEVEDRLSRMGQISPIWGKSTQINGTTIFYVKVDASIINGPSGKFCGSVKYKKG